MENNPHQKTWEEIQDHGILPGIQSWEDYVQEYEQNQIALRGFLLKVPSLWTKETIRETHRLLFQNIAPWAGEFSTRQEMIASIPGSPPELRDTEFGLLEEQITLLEETAESELARIRIAAFHHSRLLCMHPFRDGNGRTARTLLAHQMRSITGGIKPFNCDKTLYIDALQAAHPSGNIAPLSNLLCKSYLGRPDPAKFLPAPFRMSSLQLETLEESRLDLSFRDQPQIINATKTPHKVCWLAKKTWPEVIWIIGGEPTATAEKAEKLWQANRKQPMSVEELTSFLTALEKLEPFVHKTGIFKNQAGASWSPVRDQLTEHYRGTIRQPIGITIG